MDAGRGPLIDAPVFAAGLGFFFGGDDQLQLSSWNSLTGVQLALSGRFIRLDGTIEAFSEPHAPNTNRTAKTTIHARGAGWLTDLSIIASGAAPLRGQTFVRVDVVRGAGSGVTVLSTLVQGYVTATKRIAYPGSPIEDSLSGAGVLRSITGSDPAAQVEISETVPTGARWRLLSFKALLVTDATVANRVAALTFDDGVTVWGAACANFNQAASLSFTYFWSSVGQAFAQVSTIAQVGMAERVMLVAASRIRTNTGAFQVTDNWGPPQYLVEEWLEAA